MLIRARMALNESRSLIVMIMLQEHAVAERSG